MGRGRPAKYSTEEERVKAKCEAVKRCLQKKKEAKEQTEQTDFVRRPRGRPTIYATEEEKRIAKCEKARTWFENNPEKIAKRNRTYYENHREEILTKRRTGFKTKIETLSDLYNVLEKMYDKKDKNTRDYIADPDIRDDLDEAYKQIENTNPLISFNKSTWYAVYNSMTEDLEYLNISNLKDIITNGLAKHLNHLTAVYFYMYEFSNGKFREDNLTKIANFLIKQTN